MDILIENKKIRLGKNQFISQGGEGSIYAHKGRAFKVYTNKKAVIPYSKIEELSVIKKPNVIKPEQLILNMNKSPIGYAMKHISNTYSLCQLFPKAFRDRTGLDLDNILKLIQKMQDTILDLHKNNILIVDLNEMNFLVDKSFKNIFFIDVDSYQTPSFPATAIMESIRDRHSSTFNELTDWFSFGIVSFQMFSSIHPFKGKHPSIKGLDNRMMQNIPVFHKDVRYPKTCLSFDLIPQAYKDWYKALFFEGKRLDPPTNPINVIIVPVETKTVIGNEDFDITELFEYNSDIIKFVSINGNRATITKKSIYINNKLSSSKIIDKNVHIGITLKNKIIVANILNNNLFLYNFSDGEVVNCDIKAEDIMSHDGRIYIKNLDILSELNLLEIGDSIHVVPEHVGNCMEKSTSVFDGVIIQNMLGSIILSIFPESKTHHQIQCQELQKYRIINAKYKNKVLIVIGINKGKYDKFILKFDDDFSSYSVRKIKDITYQGINFIVLDNGITVHINEDEEIEVFSNKKDSNTLKVINNNVISGDMKLFNDGMQVVFGKDKKLYRLKMKDKN